ncbi:acyl-CoA thioesterase [Leptospira idonii]|uniref:Acyl-CoA thioesterase n=1 Tax=Leptospira idonii TaxID=1193500 RepID=A0A4R9M4S9_9LEPT|nr:thioesterase family protein [Leptospira idonii]TGN20971.1 acyl-CoA thioesterase [Leptospira idonii]
MIITPIQVRFNDMDPMRRVNNASYSAYLELARLDFCNRYLNINTLEDIPFVLARVEMDLLHSVYPVDKISVKTIVSRIGTTSWDFDYEIVNMGNEMIHVKAKTVQVYFDYHKKIKVMIPESFRAILEKEMG